MPSGTTTQHNLDRIEDGANDYIGRWADNLNKIDSRMPLVVSGTANNPSDPSNQFVVIDEADGKVQVYNSATSSYKNVATTNISETDHVGSDHHTTGNLTVSHGALQSGTASSQHHTRPSAGDGLTDDSDTFNINVSDFAGSLLQDDGSDNLDVIEGSIDHDNIQGVSSDDHHPQIDARDNGSSVTDGPSFMNFTNNLSVTASGTGVTVDASAATGVDVEDSTTLINSGTDNINFGSNLDVTDDGDNSVTVDSSAGGSAITLDLDDDDSNESTDLQEIATDNDRNSAITEPSADKALIEPYKIGAVEGYLQHDGLVISNNGTDGDHDIDTVGGAVGVHDFSGNWRVVELPDETPAFQIDGTSDTAGALINGSSLTADTWYELGIIADSSGSNSPSVVGYTDANRPTASGDLPSGYDLFRAMGAPGKTWWIRTDGNSNIKGFFHSSDGVWTYTGTEILNLARIESTSSPSNQENTLDISSQVPPTTLNIWINSFEIGSTTTGNRIGGLVNESVASHEQTQVKTIASDNTKSAVTGWVNNITNQQLIRHVSTTSSIEIETEQASSFKAVN